MIGRLGNMQGLTWASGTAPEGRRKRKARTYDKKKSGRIWGLRSQLSTHLKSAQLLVFKL